nr:ATP synthase F1 subunit delta [Bartonella raoultii]
MPLVEQRYGQALFDLAQERGAVENVEKAVASFGDVLKQNEDLKRGVQSPFFSEEEQIKMMHSICECIKFADEKTGQIVRNFLCVIALNRRLYALSGILEAFKRCVASSRKEVTAQIISACPLTAQQEKELRVVLEGVIGGKVLLHICVDPEILGGLIIRVGSMQIDTSLVAKLSSLKLALKKEVS